MMLVASPPCEMKALRFTSLGRCWRSMANALSARIAALDALMPISGMPAACAVSPV
jgi:hypothetical protein